MAASDQFFLSPHDQEHRPLSAALNQRRTALFRAIQRLSTEELLQHSATDLLNRLWATVPSAPHSGRGPLLPQPISITLDGLLDDEGKESELYIFKTTQRIPTLSWTLQFTPTWPTDLESRWPDMCDDGLEPDEASNSGPPPCIKWRIQRTRKIQASCHIAHDDALRGDPPEDLIEEAVDKVNLYVSGFNRQIEQWKESVAEQAVDEIRRRRAVRQRGRANRGRINQRFEQWRTPEIDEKPVERRSVPVDAAPGQPAFLEVLPSTTIENVVQVINRWTHAVEKYPDAFVELDEEALSSLLVATLNGAFVRAEREVFVGGGRGDFYISGTEIPVTGIPSIFSGENKWWVGETKFLEAVGQALRNLIKSSPDTVLIVMVKDRASFTESKQTGLRSLHGSRRFLGEVDNVAGQPTVRMRSPIDTLAEVRLTIVFVDLTRPPMLRRKTKGGRSKPAEAKSRPRKQMDPEPNATGSRNGKRTRP